MFKRNVKIVILFLLIIVVLIGGRHLFRKLEYNKQSFSADIYSYISPSAETVIHVNRGYSIPDIYVLYPSIKNLIETLGNEYSMPVIISIFQNGESVLLTKANHKQESNIKSFIKQSVSALSYSVKKRPYKDAELLFYSLEKNEFLVCTFYKGLFAASKDYRPIEKFIDSDPENTFFSDNKEFVGKMLESASVSIYIKLKNNFLALNYIARNDSVKLDGYILKPDSLPADNAAISYLIKKEEILLTEIRDLLKEQDKK